MRAGLLWWKTVSEVPDRLVFFLTSFEILLNDAPFHQQPLVIPGRVLVGEGVLTKMCRKKPKSRQFFLFNDILVYGNIVISKKKVIHLHILT